MGSSTDTQTQDLRTQDPQLESVSTIESGNYVVTVSSFCKASGTTTLEKLVTDFLAAGGFAQLHRQKNTPILKAANAMRLDVG